MLINAPLVKRFALWGRSLRLMWRKAKWAFTATYLKSEAFA